MTTIRRLLILSLILAVGAIWAGDVEAKRNKGPKIATGPMDDGKMDPFWFGEGLEFREADEIDYLWVKDDFSANGKTLHFVAWPEPEFLGEKAAERDEDDYRLARQMNSEMARTFSDVLGEELGSKAQTSLTEGDIKVEGRIVDCSTGSKAAKIVVGFGAGSGGTTVDLKFTDAATGELLVGIHHRVVSGTTWSTTDSKFVKWVEELGENIVKKGLAALYAKGDPTNK